MSLKRIFFSLVIILSAHCLFGSETAEFYRLTSLSNTVDNANQASTLCGIVTHVSNIRPGLFVVAATDKPYRFGIPVYLDEKIVRPQEGDQVWVAGHTMVTDIGLSIRADSYVRVNTLDIDFETIVRYDRLRKGQLDLRRVIVEGQIISVSHEAAKYGCRKFTVLRVRLPDGAVAMVRVPGKLDKRRYKNKVARLTGCVFPIPDGAGGFAARVVEVQNEEGINIVHDKEHDWHIISIYIGGALLLCAFLMSFVAWIRSKNEKMKINAVAAERKRMAADLHDTIEQHIACVKLLISSTLQNDVLPEATRETLERASTVLANTKVQVRDAVYNLRSDEAATKSPEEALREVATALNHQGKISCKAFLEGLPERLAPRRFQDLLSIVRETITNAIKHGKASEIEISSRESENGGFILHVKNNGAPFEAKSALGPETGHFGLAGIFERAARSKFKVDYSHDAKWMMLTLRAEKAEK